MAWLAVDSDGRERIFGSVPERSNKVDVENPSNTFSSSVAKFINKLHPITMPYTPSSTKFKVYVREWLTDKTHGDFDVQEVIGYEDQQGQWHDYNEFLYMGDDGIKWITDDKEKEKLRDARIDKIENKIAASLINDIRYIFLTDDMYEHDKDNYDKIKQIVNYVINTYYLSIRCKCYVLAKRNQHGICYLNTYHNHRVIVNGSDKDRNKLIEESIGLKGLIEVVDNVKEEIKDLIDKKFN